MAQLALNFPLDIFVNSINLKKDISEISPFYNRLAWRIVSFVLLPTTLRQAV